MCLIYNADSRAAKTLLNLQTFMEAEANNSFPSVSMCEFIHGKWLGNSYSEEFVRRSRARSRATTAPLKQEGEGFTSTCARFAPVVLKPRKTKETCKVVPLCRPSSSS